MWLRLPYPASAGEGVPYEWRHMIKTCSQVRLPASLRHLGGEGGSGNAAEEGKEKLLPPLLAWSWSNKGFCDLRIKYQRCNVWLY